MFFTILFFAQILYFNEIQFSITNAISNAFLFLFFKIIRCFTFKEKKKKYFYYLFALQKSQLLSMNARFFLNLCSSFISFHASGIHFRVYSHLHIRIPFHHSLVRAGQLSHELMAVLTQQTVVESAASTTNTGFAVMSLCLPYSRQQTILTKFQFSHTPPSLS